MATNELTDLLNGKQSVNPEPLLTPSLECYAPADNNEMDRELGDFLELQRSNFWTAGEINVTDDLVHMRSRLVDRERDAVRIVLGFFRFADSIVARNIDVNLGAEVKPFKAVANYRFQAMMEDIHAQTYTDLLRALFPGKEQTIQDEVLKSDVILAKIKWMAEWMNDKTTFDQRLIAFAFVEGVFFSSSFATIFWFKSRGLLPGLVQSNELIARDEGMHTDYSCLLHKYIKTKTYEQTVHEIAKAAVLIEIEFAKATFPEPISDMNADRMTHYIQFVADRLLTQLGYSTIYNVKNPFKFMDNMGTVTKTSFFEASGTSYFTPSTDKTLIEVADF